MIWIILSSTATLVIDIVFAVLFGKAAEGKGYSKASYFWICLLFGAIGWILVAALPDKRLDVILENQRILMQNTQKGKNNKGGSSKNDRLSEREQTNTGDHYPEGIPTEDINRVKCPHCGRVVSAGIGEKGVKECPYCNKNFTLPEIQGDELSDDDFTDMICPSCGNIVSVDTELNEHEITCPFCNETIRY